MWDLHKKTFDDSFKETLSKNALNPSVVFKAMLTGVALLLNC